MSIRSIDRYVSRLWDWSIFDGCFGRTGISVSDIDGIVERKGKFLVLEAKSHRGCLNEGQERLLRRLASEPSFTVIVVYGRTGRPSEMTWMSEQEEVTIRGGEEQLRRWVGEWYRQANCRRRAIKCPPQ